MDIESSLKSDPQSAIVLQPSECPLDHPAMSSKSFSGLDPTTRNPGNDTALPQFHAAARVVVPFVEMRLVWAEWRSAALSPYRRNGIDRLGHHLGIMSVRRRDRSRERYSSLIDHEVMFRAVFPAVGGIRANAFAPFLAGTADPSTATRSMAMRSALFKAESAACHMASQVPSSCHSTRRRQHVTPDGRPIPFGSICQGIPVRRTKMMPARAMRSSHHGRPPFLDCRRGGMSGRTTAQTLSGTRSIPAHIVALFN